MQQTYQFKEYSMIKMFVKIIIVVVAVEGLSYNLNMNLSHLDTAVTVYSPAKSHPHFVP